MLPHIDGGKHQRFGDERGYNLIVILDNATGDEEGPSEGYPVDQLFKRPKVEWKRIVRELWIGVYRIR